MIFFKFIFTAIVQRAGPNKGGPQFGDTWSRLLSERKERRICMQMYRVMTTHIGLLLPLLIRECPTWISAPLILSEQQSPLLVTVTKVTLQVFFKSTCHQGSISALVWLQDPLVYMFFRSWSMALLADPSLFHCDD